MTVGELRKKLEGIDPETKVVVQWEIDVEPTYFDVANISLRKGTLSRFEGIAGFKFGGDGSSRVLRQGGSTVGIDLDQRSALLLRLPCAVRRF
jgi:hypothetical protein